MCQYNHETKCSLCEKGGISCVNTFMELWCFPSLTLFIELFSSTDNSGGCDTVSHGRPGPGSTRPEGKMLTRLIIRILITTSVLLAVE